MRDPEEQLRSHAPREPSADYFRRGIERIRTAAPNDGNVASSWRFAAVALAGMLSISVALNLVLWVRERNPDVPIALVTTPIPADAPRLEVRGSLAVSESWLALRGEVQVGEQWFTTIDSTPE